MRASNAFLAVEVGLGVAFTVLLWLGFYRTAGIVEWVMAFGLTFWFWAFWGFLLEGEEDREDVGMGEESPLLR